MGAGASTAAPQDIALLEACVNALEDKRCSAADAIDDLMASHLAHIVPERLDALKPVLEAAVQRYFGERTTQSHGSAVESALVAARSCFSSGKLPPVHSPCVGADKKLEESPTSKPDPSSCRCKSFRSLLPSRLRRGRRDDDH